MNNEYQELKNQAENLRKQRQFDQALLIYETLWQQQSDEPDQWIGWGYAQCLRKVGRSSEALAVCREVYQISSDFDQNNNLYGWCVYDIGIKQPKDSFDERNFLQAAEAIMQLTRHEDYSPYERAIFAVVHHYEHYKASQKPVPHQLIVEWLEKLNPDALSNEANRGSDGKSYASPKEDWYSSWSKALLGLGRYEECISVSSHALSEFRKLHYDYDVWFRKNRAESYLALEEGEKALPDLEYMMDRKPDAWVRHKYAVALRQLGRLESAIGYACEAALPHQRLGFRWEVYLDLGNMLAETGDIERARQHILLAAAIRQDEGWDKIPKNLYVAFQTLELTGTDIPDAKSLHRDLQPFWKSMQPCPKTTHTGTIIRIHANGKSGHIAASDGFSQYFFGMRNYKGDAEATEDMPVMFNLQENQNKKTGEKELHAVDIYPGS